MLHEEEVVVDKRAVPKERVRLEKDSVTEEETVLQTVREEEIDVDKNRRRSSRRAGGHAATCPPSRTRTRTAPTQRVPLDAEEHALFRRLAQEGGARAREAIVRAIHADHRQLARRYGHGANLEDLEQVHSSRARQGHRSLRPGPRPGVLLVRLPDDR